MAAVTIALTNGGSGLSADERCVLQDSPGQWRIEQAPGKHPWLKLIFLGDGRCLDLSNPDQVPQLAPDADVSGQYWQAMSQIGCKEEDGAMMRCLMGYTLHAMWTGPDMVLTAHEGSVELKPQGQDGQVWEILNEDGSPWTPPGPQVIEPVVDPPELIECLGPPEPELIMCGEPMICGGFAPPTQGGPTELLNELREQAQAVAAEQGWNDIFTEWEGVSYRTQVVAGTNYDCKVKIGEDICAHICIYQPLPGQGPARVTSMAVPKTMDDPL